MDQSIVKLSDSIALALALEDENDDFLQDENSAYANAYFSDTNAYFPPGVDGPISLPMPAPQYFAVHGWCMERDIPCVVKMWDMERHAEALSEVLLKMPGGDDKWEVISQVVCSADECAGIFDDDVQFSSVYGSAAGGFVADTVLRVGGVGICYQLSMTRHEDFMLLHMEAEHDTAVSRIGFWLRRIEA